MSTDQDTISALANQEYKYGFYTEIESETVPAGLTEDTVRLISAKKGEPEYMLEWRLRAYRKWLEMEEPAWAFIKYPPINYQEVIYYSAPVKKPALESMDQVDPELVKTYEKLGIP